MSPLAFPIVWAIGMLAFAAILAGRLRRLRGARPAGRLDQLPRRVRHAVTEGLGQRKFLRGEQPAGIMHALIFWGFCVLLLQVVALYGRAFDAAWSPPWDGAVFWAMRDAIEIIVAAAVVYMLYRRLIAHTPRLFGIGGAEQRYREAPHWEGVLILAFILFIVAGSFAYDHFDLAFGWWLHNVTVLAFLCLLPLTKHFHVLTGIPNVLLAKLPPQSAPRPLAIDTAPAAGVLGVGTGI